MQYLYIFELHLQYTFIIYIYNLQWKIVKAISLSKKKSLLNTLHFSVLDITEEGYEERYEAWEGGYVAESGCTATVLYDLLQYKIQFTFTIYNLL